jgi:hypothetical protein
VLIPRAAPRPVSSPSAFPKGAFMLPILGLTTKFKYYRGRGGACIKYTGGRRSVEIFTRCSSTAEGESPTLVWWQTGYSTVPPTSAVDCCSGLLQCSGIVTVDDPSLCMCLYCTVLYPGALERPPRFPTPHSIYFRSPLFQLAPSTFSPPTVHPALDLHFVAPWES